MQITMIVGPIHHCNTLRGASRVDSCGCQRGILDAASTAFQRLDAHSSNLYRSHPGESRACVVVWGLCCGIRVVDGGCCPRGPWKVCLGFVVACKLLTVRALLELGKSVSFTYHSPCYFF